MPGPVSDAYDPEFGTRERAHQLIEALDHVYDEVSAILGGRKPMFIMDLVDADLPDRLSALLTEKEWRLLRFALERAKDSI